MIRLATIEDLPTILNIYEYARSFMKKNGFIKCGTIYVEDGSPRIAFEKIYL